MIHVNRNCGLSAGDDDRVRGLFKSDTLTTNAQPTCENAHEGQSNERNGHQKPTMEFLLQ